MFDVILYSIGILVFVTTGMRSQSYRQSHYVASMDWGARLLLVIALIALFIVPPVWWRGLIVLTLPVAAAWRQARFLRTRDVAPNDDDRPLGASQQ